MAKVILDNVTPDAFPRIRGRFLTHPIRGQIIARGWPKKRGDNQHPNSQWTAKQFAYVGQMTANAFPLDWQTAIYMTKGTDWVPRDLLTRAAFGTAYEVTLAGGDPWPVVPKSPPPPRRDPVMQWQFNQFDNAYNTNIDTAATCWKGGILVPDTPMQIAATQAIFTAVINGTYQMLIAALDATNAITDLVFSAPQTLGTNDRRWREFDTQAQLSPGVRYAVMVGRIDAAANYALPLAMNTTPKWLMPVISLGNARIAKITPAVGDVVGFASANTPFFGLLAEF